MSLGFTTTSSYGNVTAIPDKGFGRTVAPNTMTVAFGDGYEQRLSRGINNNLETFNITLSNRTKEDADNIADYLSSLKGVTSFNFNIPDHGQQGGSNNEKTIKVVCMNYNVMYGQSNHFTISMQLKRVYEA